MAETNRQYSGGSGVTLQNSNPAFAMYDRDQVAKQKADAATAAQNQVTTTGAGPNTAAMATAARQRAASMADALAPKTGGTTPQNAAPKASKVNAAVQSNILAGLAGQPSDSLQRMTRMGADAMARKASDMRAQTGSAIAANGLMDQGAGIRAAQGTEQQLAQNLGSFLGDMGQTAADENRAFLEQGMNLLSEENKVKAADRQLKLSYDQLKESTRSNKAQEKIQSENSKNDRISTLTNVYRDSIATNPAAAGVALKQMYAEMGIEFSDQQLQDMMRVQEETGIDVVALSADQDALIGSITLDGTGQPVISGVPVSQLDGTQRAYLEKYTSGIGVNTIEGVRAFLQNPSLTWDPNAIQNIISNISNNLDLLNDLSSTEVQMLRSKGMMTTQSYDGRVWDASGMTKHDLNEYAGRGVIPQGMIVYYGGEFMEWDGTQFQTTTGEE